MSYIPYPLTNGNRKTAREKSEMNDRRGNEIECPDEEMVFRLLGWSWMPPERRS